MNTNLVLEIGGPVDVVKCGAAGGTVPSNRIQELQATWDDAALELRRFVGSMLLDATKADDVLQDVYLAALYRMESFPDRTIAREWLFRVAINRCRLEYRKHHGWQKVFRRISGFAHAIQIERDDPPVHVNRRQERDAVRKAIDCLAFKYRAPIVMTYFLELDSTEIGRILSLSPSTVRGRVRNARRKLASALADLGIEE